MSEQPMLLNVEEQKPLPKSISIDIRRLRMKDYHSISNAKSSGFEVMALLIVIIGRISNYTEEELWEMEMEDYLKVQEAFFEAFDNIVKKTNAGS
jgi:hypothetical protein